MLLAIDVGNTNITLGVFSTQKESGRSLRGRISSAAPSSPNLIASWRLSTFPNATVDEYGTKILDVLHYATIDKLDIKAFAVSSVVPSLTGVLQEIAQKYFKLTALVIDEKAKLPLTILTENPKELGADRIVNAVAALARFSGPCIVVDFGTAATFDCVTKKGEYAGGIIVPGPALSAESLSLHTAKLPRVKIAKPARLIGKNTVESIQSGLYFGYVSLIDGILDRLKQELGSGSKVIATGGLASLLATDSKYIRKDAIFPDLTLEGIYLVWEKNR